MRKRKQGCLRSNRKRGRNRQNTIAEIAERVAFVRKGRRLCVQFSSAFVCRQVFDAGKSRCLPAGFSGRRQRQRDFAARSFDERVLFSLA